MKELEKLSKTELIAELREFRKMQQSMVENETEKSAAGIKLKESEERFRQMFNKHNAVMLLIEPETGKIIDANLSAQNFYGYPDGTLKQMTIQDINSLPEEEVREMRKQAHEENHNYFVFPHHLANGEIRTVEVHSSPIIINKEYVLFSVIHDITERKQAEGALRENQVRHAAMIANISDVISIIDADGTIKYQSPNIERWFGWQPNDFIGTSGWDKIHPDDIERIQKEFAKVVESENDVTEEYRFRCKDGIYKWIELTAVNRINNPVIDGVLLNYHDITKRKQVEFAEKERLKELDCFYGISKIAEIPDLSLEEIIPRVISLVSTSWQHPEISVCRIIIDGIEYKEPNFKKTNWGQHSDIKVVGKKIGIIEVCYLEKMPDLNEGPFLKEERLLLNAVAENMGHIIERKRAEKDLKESEEYFRALIENSSDVISILDDKGNITYESPSHKKVLGYEIGKLIGESAFGLVHPDDRERISKQFVKLLKRPNEIEKVDFRFLHEDGTWKYVEGTSTNLLHSSKIKGIVVNYRDVTERKQTEEALAQSTKRLIQAQQIAKMGDFTWDVATGEVSWSDGLFDLLKYDKTEKIDYAKVNKDIHHPDDLLEVSAWLNEGIATGEEKLLPKEYRLICKDGEVIYVCSQGIIERKEGGAVKLIATLYDITERRQAESQIKENEERFNLAVKGSNDAIWDWDNMESDEYWWSDRLYEILGYKPGEVEALISNWQKWMHPDDSDNVAEVLNKHLEDNHPYQVEFRMQKKSGDYVWVAVSGESIRDKNGKPTRMAGSVSDITGHKHVELALKKRNEYIESILENMPIGFAVNTIDDGDVKFTNKNFEEIYGWSKDVLSNTSIFFDKVFPDPEYRKKMTAQIIADMQSGDPERMQWKDLKIITKAGEERFVLAHNIPLLDQNLMISTVQETTKRKLAEDEIKKYQGHLEDLVKERTQELETINKELERINNLFVDREFRIKELREKVKELENKNGQLKDLK